MITYMGEDINIKKIDDEVFESIISDMYLDYVQNNYLSIE